MLRGLLTLLAVVAAILTLGYFYALSRADETIRAQAETMLDQHYTLNGLEVTVGGARRIDDRGIELRDIVFRERFGPESGQEVARINEMFLACDCNLQKLVNSEPVIEAITLRGVRIRARLADDGSCNANRLFPMPQPTNADQPLVPILIEDGSIELADNTNRSNPFSLRHIQAKILPEVFEGNERFAIQVSGANDHFKRLELSMAVDADTGLFAVDGKVDRLAFSPRFRASLPRQISDSLLALEPLRGNVDLKYQAAGSIAHLYAEATNVASATNAANANKISAIPADNSNTTNSNLSNDLSASIATAATPFQFQIDGKVTDARINHPRLPYPLTNLVADIQINNDGLIINSLRASSGRGALEISGRKEGFEANSPLVLSGSARQLALDPQLAKSLPPEMLETWRYFSPHGVVNLDFAVSYDGITWKPEVDVELIDAGFAFYLFPYPVDSAAGRIRLRNDKLTVTIRGLASGQVVRIDGEVFNPGPNYTGRVTAELEGAIPIDETLLAQLDPSTQQAVRSLDPRGFLIAKGVFGRTEPSDESMYRRIMVELRDCALKFRDFPYPVENVQGEIELDNDLIVVRNLQGRNDSAYIVGDGFWRLGDNSRLEMHLTATDAPLDDDLRLALTPQLRQLWSDLQIRGEVDHVKADIVYETATENLDVKVRCQKWQTGALGQKSTITIQPKWFPYRLNELAGVLTYENNRVTMQNMTARHGDTTLSFSGQTIPLENDTWQLDISPLVVDRIVVDNDLLAALPPEMRKATANLNLSGPLAMQGGFRYQTGGGINDRAQWDFRFDLENGSLHCNQKFDHIHGGARLVGGSDGASFNCRGELDVDSVIYKETQFTSVQGPFWIDSDRLLFGAWAEPVNATNPRRITANTLGGILSGDAQVLLTPESPFVMRLNLANADLKTVSQEVGNSLEVSGKMFANLDLSGNSLGPHTFRGRGGIQLRDANIYELPVMLAMLKLLRQRDPTQSAFDSGDINFTVQGEHVYFNRMTFTGDAITVKGKGEMNLQREIDFDFYTVVGRDEFFVPVISPALGLASQQLLQIHATGTLDKPEVVRRPLPGVEATLNDIFPEDAIRPLPPISDTLTPSNALLPRWFNR